MDRASPPCLALLLLLSACNDDGGTGGGTGTCIDDVFSCPAGQTCWIDAEGVAFECLPSGAGQDGDTCQNSVGQPTCGQDLACLQLQGDETGICSPYCDRQSADHGCPDFRECMNVELGDATFQACAPLEP